MIKKIKIIIILSFFLFFVKGYSNTSVINEGKINLKIVKEEEKSEYEKMTNDVYTNVVGKGIYTFEEGDDFESVQRIKSFKEKIIISSKLKILKKSGENLKIKGRYQGEFEVDNVKLYYKKVKENSDGYGEEIPLNEDYQSEVVSFKEGEEYEVTLVAEVVDVLNLGAIGRGTLTVEKENLTKDSLSSKVIINNNINESGMILLSKEVSREKVFLGELVKYTVKVKNKTNIDLDELLLTDYLPVGLELIKESIQVSEGYTYEKDRQIRNAFALTLKSKEGVIKKDEEVEVSYVVLVKVMAKIGNNKNLVRVKGKKNNYYFYSNTASAEVEVQSDIFANKGVLFGRTFIDKNKNNIYDKGDISVPGVKIYLENGDYAITDIDGKYSLYGQNAITHIAKIQTTSLPSGLTARKISNKHSENGLSAFINLKMNQLYKCNFAFDPVTEKIEKRILGRKEILENEKTEIERLVFDKELEFKKIRGDIEKKRGEGTVSGRGMPSFEGVDKSSSDEEDEDDLGEVETYVSGDIPYDELDDILVVLDNELDFLNVKDGDLVKGIMNFQVKGPKNGTLNIYINDKVVPLDRIGISASSKENQLFFLEYNAVAMDPGENKVELTYADPFGNVRARKEIKLLVTGEFKEFTLEKYEEDLESDIVKLKLEAKDEYGNPINHDVGISIYSDSGTWASIDSDTSRSGLQTISNKNGMALLKFYPEPGSRKVKFNVDVEGKEKVIELPINGREVPFFINGILEGRVDFNKDFGKEMYLFEEKLHDIDKNTKHLYSYRNAIFGEGNIYKDYYLTFSYDNTKETDRMFGYVDPEDYFLVYGDNSVKGYQAKSTSRFYGKLEKEKSYLMYGDYNTSDVEDKNTKVGKYSRSLTGGIGNYEKDNLKVGAFISEVTTTQVIEKIRGKGLSGPYRLKTDEIVEGSEKIDIVIYKSGTFSLELERQTLRRFEDYTIDYDLGEIYFSEPILSSDEEGNPIYIEINYELENDSDEETHLVYGVNGNYTIKDWITLGFNYVKDDNPDEESEIRSVSTLLEKENYKFYMEYGETNTFDKKDGSGLYAEYHYKKDNLKIDSVYKVANDNFDNSNASVNANQEVGEINADYTYSEKNTLKVNSSLQIDKNTQNQKREVYLGNNHEFNEEISLEGGFKYYHVDKGKKDDQEETDLKINTLGAKVRWKPKNMEKLSTFLEYEQDIFNSEYNRMAMGAKYQIKEKTSFYVRNESFSNLQEVTAISGEDEKNKWLLGIESEIFGGSQAFSEYRVRKNGDNEEPEVGSGVKKDWVVNDSLKIRGTFERVEPLEISEDDTREPRTSLTFGFDWKINEKTLTKSDFEFSWDQKETFLNKFNFGKNIGDSFYLVGKNRYYEQSTGEMENRLILGVAYREYEEDKYNTLNKYELNLAENIEGKGVINSSHIFRTTHNYQFTEKDTLSGTFAVEYREYRYPLSQDLVLDSHYVAYLLAGVYNRDIGERWNAGVGCFVIGDEGWNAAYSGISLELGYLIKNNVWVSLGYNYIMHTEVDSSTYSEFTKEYDEGFNIRIRANIGDIFDRFNQKKKD